MRFKLWSCALAAAVALLVPSLGHAINSPRLERPLRAPQHEALKCVGWDYDRIGMTLSPGEEMALRFENVSPEGAEAEVFWALTTYTNKPITQGKSQLSVDAGETGEIPIAVPDSLADGAYYIKYSFRAEDLPNGRLVHIDYRQPASSERLGLNLVALVHNMDSENWVRAMVGPVSDYANVWASWPDDDSMRADAAVVIGEFLPGGPEASRRLDEYVRGGGVMLAMGRTSPEIADLLPVTLAEEPLQKVEPMRLRPSAEGPWQDFDPQAGPKHYPVQVTARDGAQVLAAWEDGSPAVVQQDLGRGKVIYVAAGADQVWQNDPAMHGADELAMRLLFWSAKDAEAVEAMLAHTRQTYSQTQQERRELLEWVFEKQPMSAPDEYYIVSLDNVGRFPWIPEEGGVVENMTIDQKVLLPTDMERSFTVSVDGADNPIPGDIDQNWLSKTIEWMYPNGQAVHSTMSLASPGLLWEGGAREVALPGWRATHIAYLSAQDREVRVAKGGEPIDPADMAEPWLVTFVADEEARDAPQLIVLTRRPSQISLSADDGLSLEFDEEGFGAMFTASLWGMRRLAPGETTGWTGGIPQSAIDTARQWSGVFMDFPVDSVQIGWVVDGDVVHLAERFKYRRMENAWGVEPVQMAPVPPVMLMAKSAGAPVEIPEDARDMACPTKFGYFRMVEGDATHATLTLPSRDHRALVQVEGRMDLQDGINARAEAGFIFRQVMDHYMQPNTTSEADDPWKDLEKYAAGLQHSYRETACIDIYKWVGQFFNGLITKPFYSDEIRSVQADFWKWHVWETFNFYAHKSLIRFKREPYTGVEYITSFCWPTQTYMGFRNIGDQQETAGIVSYALAGYGRYYGDWTTLRANWNHIERFYYFLPKINDWANMSSGAWEYWSTAGFDMLNSEYQGNIGFAYLAKNTGHRWAEVRSLVTAARCLCPTVGRLNWPDYIAEITAEGDPWREHREYQYFDEYWERGQANIGGGIGLLDTSKGMAHELALAYKEWAPVKTDAREKAMVAQASQRGGQRGQGEAPPQGAAGGRRGGQNAAVPGNGNVANETIQRLFLGWDRQPMWEAAKASAFGPSRRRGWGAQTGVYNMAVLSIGDIPLFLSDWTPAEYVTGHYDPEARELVLQFVNHEDTPYTVKIYSQRIPEEISVDGKALDAGKWQYDKSTGWLRIDLEGEGPREVQAEFGQSAAPLHPYFTKVGEAESGQ